MTYLNLKYFNTEKDSYTIASVLVLGYLLLCYFFILIKFPLWLDETRFYETAVSFSKDFSFQHILHYDELITPFSFMAYGLWGKLFGTDYHIIRILSLFVGFATHISLFILLKHFFKGKILWILFLTWLLNPYVVGLNALIFTDGFSNLWTILFILALVKHKSPIYSLVLSALLLLTRQYNIIIIISALIFYLIEYYKTKNKREISYAISLLLGCIPMAALFIFWKGLSPPGLLTDKLNKVPFTLYPESITVYIYCIYIYTLPLSLIALPLLKKQKLKTLLLTSGFSLIFYLLFPVKPSGIAVESGVYTVGLFDKLITKIFTIDILKHIIFYISFFLGLSILLLYRKKNFTIRKIQNKAMFFIIYVLLFLLIMMFNFQIWEKYFLQILPIALIMVGTLSFDLKNERLEKLN